MNIKYKYLLLFTFIFFTCNFLGASNNQDQINYKRVGYPYYPEIKLTDADSLKYPINYEVSLNIYGIKATANGVNLNKVLPVNIELTN